MTDVPMSEIGSPEFVDHRGWRFYAPFCCGRCGVSITARQFAFGRACGACDLGHSRERLSPDDDRWFLAGRAELVDPQNPWLIHPEFIPASDAEKYPRLQAPPRWPPKPKPAPKPKLIPPRRGLSS